LAAFNALSSYKYDHNDNVGIQIFFQHDITKHVRMPTSAKKLKAVVSGMHMDENSHHFKMAWT